MTKIYNDLQSAKAAANKASLDNPGSYVYLLSCFGLMLSVNKRLNVFSPSDAYGETYWLNGKEKPFTAAQKIADQNATPTLS